MVTAQGHWGRNGQGYMRSVQKESSYVILKIEAFIEEDTRNIVHRTITLSPLQSRYLGTSHTVLPITISYSIIFSWISSMIWNIFPKMILVLGKARNCRVWNLGCRGAESPDWFDVSPKNSARDTVYEWAHCHNEAANHQLPIAAAFWIIRIDSMEECSSLTQNLMQIHCSTHSVIFNVTATPFTSSLNGIYRSFTSRVKPSLFTHAYSSPLSLAARLHWCLPNHSCFINNGWTFSWKTLYFIHKPRWRSTSTLGRSTFSKFPLMSPFPRLPFFFFFKEILFIYF